MIYAHALILNAGTWLGYLNEVLFALYIFTPLTVDTRAYLSSRALRDCVGVPKSLHEHNRYYINRFT